VQPRVCDAVPAASDLIDCGGDRRALTHGCDSQQAKVFWFFFSKKNAFFFAGVPVSDGLTSPAYVA
jgi:hypothetical protein